MYHLPHSTDPSILETDSISPDWEDIPYRDDVAGLVGLSGSQTTLVPEPQDQVEQLTTPSIESSTSPPLSAEAVAKSLLKKFANKKHPAASELQWLVSENDVPQSLLPLPQGYSVAPDDVREQEDLPSKERRSSAPVSFPRDRNFIFALLFLKIKFISSSHRVMFFLLYGEANWNRNRSLQKLAGNVF